MSYFEFFCSNNKNIVGDKQHSIVGTCYLMCPQVEIDLRLKEKLVHVLEVDGKTKNLIKSYSRSAADSNIAVPELLRPFAVLENTVQHLLNNILLRTDVPTHVVYDFVDDRLRAIRQDMTIQRLPPEQCAGLLEPMVRFYVYYGYNLVDLSYNDFNPVLNKKYLLECMKWFLHCCDSLEQSQCDNKELSALLKNLDISQKNISFDRVLIESLYILCNMEDIHPLVRYLNLSKDLKCKKSLQLAYFISLANTKGNYIYICSEADRLCPLTYFAFSLHLPKIQKNALKIMSHAYNSKQLMVPVDVLKRWLHFGSNEETAAVCKHYGLKVINHGVIFNKAEFKTDVSLHSLQKGVFNDEKYNLKYIFTYRTNES